MGAVGAIGSEQSRTIVTTMTKLPAGLDPGTRELCQKLLVQHGMITEPQPFADFARADPLDRHRVRVFAFVLQLHRQLSRLHHGPRRFEGEVFVRVAGDDSDRVRFRFGLWGGRHRGRGGCGRGGRGGGRVGDFLAGPEVLQLHDPLALAVPFDVPDDALAVERSPQTNREGGATRYRELKTKGKPPKGG